MGRGEQAEEDKKRLDYAWGSLKPQDATPEAQQGAGRSRSSTAGQEGEGDVSSPRCLRGPGLLGSVGQDTAGSGTLQQPVGLGGALGGRSAPQKLILFPWWLASGVGATPEGFFLGERQLPEGRARVWGGDPEALPGFRA